MMNRRNKINILHSRVLKKSEHIHDFFTAIEIYDYYTLSGANENIYLVDCFQISKSAYHNEEMDHQSIKQSECIKEILFTVGIEYIFERKIVDYLLSYVHADVVNVDLCYALLASVMMFSNEYIRISSQCLANEISIIAMLMQYNGGLDFRVQNNSLTKFICHAWNQHIDHAIILSFTNHQQMIDHCNCILVDTDVKWRQMSEKKQIQIYDDAVCSKPIRSEYILGSGIYGSVYEATVQNDRIALKIIPIDNQEGFGRREMIEWYILSHCQHENIITLHGYGWNVHASKFMLGLELMEGHLKLLHKSDLTLSVQQSLIRQLLKGVIYLHEHHIIHGDIHLRNILISNMQLKITDFGISVLDYEKELIDGLFYPIDCRPIEVLLRAQPYTNKMDVWATGCVIYYLLMGEDMWKQIDFPYDEKSSEFQNEKRMIQAIVNRFGPITSARLTNTARMTNLQIKPDKTIAFDVFEPYASILLRFFTYSDVKRCTAAEGLQLFEASW